MSKDIWHTGKEIPDEDQYVVVKNNMGLYTVSSEFEYDFDRIEKWAYFDDFLALETELERTRKALDVAKEGLKEIRDKGEYVNPIELAESYLDEITALEQKDKQCQ